MNAAVPRGVWSELPFADDLIMSEDQEWSRRALLSGKTLVYEPRAAVFHSHAYTVASAFRRFFDSGVSAERSYASGGAAPANAHHAATLRRRSAGDSNAPTSTNSANAASPPYPLEDANVASTM